MSHPRAQEVLYESEAALRLVDQELSSLHQVQREEPRHVAAGLADLPGILASANEQILSVLTRLRVSRAELQISAMDKLQVTHEKIREVTSATEDAAIDIMDACDRATSLVDQLDAIDAAPEPDRAQASDVRATLRDELFLMIGALQFQDITAQQLSHASAVLVEMEERLNEVAKLFDTSMAVIDVPRSVSIPSAQTGTFDPNATTRDADSRQALADEIFTAIKAPAA